MPLLILDPVVLNQARKKKPVAVQPIAEDNVVVLPHDQVDEVITRPHKDLTDIGRAARSGMNAAYLGPIGFSIYTPELDLANLTDVWVLSTLSQSFTLS